MPQKSLICCLALLTVQPTISNTAAAAPTLPKRFIPQLNLDKLPRYEGAPPKVDQTARPTRSKSPTPVPPIRQRY